LLEPSSSPLPTTSPTKQQRKRQREIARATRKVIKAGISFVVFFLLWEATIRLFEVRPYLVPAPTAVASALWDGFSSGLFFAAVRVTVTEVLLGLLAGTIIGISIGTLLVTIPVLDQIFYPYVVALQTVPKVAIAPLFIIWFGFGIESKIVIVTMTCMFPILVNTIAGLRSTEADRIALVKALCGSSRQLFWYVQLPSALPYIFAGLNTAVILAIIGAIVGEFVGARQGIGVQILQANLSMNIAGAFALIVVLAAIGVFLSGVVSLIEGKVCFWKGKSVK
jgi:NitT/TauT family transport system permease protein